MAIEQTQRIEQEKTLLTWKAPSRPFRSKEKRALTVPMVIAILVAFILVIAGEWVLIAVVAALVFAYYMWTTVPPEEAEFSLTTRGVRAHGSLYTWDTLVRRWVEQEWDHDLMIVETPMVLGGRLILPMGKNREAVEGEMSKYLLMEKPPDTALDKMGKWMEEKFPLEEKI